MENIEEINENWTEIKGKLKQKFAILTENNILLVGGKQEEILGRLEIKLGKTKSEIRKIISEL